MELSKKHMKMMDQLYYGSVGLNIGTGYVKGRCGDRVLPEIPAIVSMVNSYINFDEMYRPDDLILEVDGVRYAFGYTAVRLGSSAQPDRSNGRMLSKDYLLLFLMSLIQLCPADLTASHIEPSVITLITPLTSYDNDRTAIKQSLTGKHEVGVVKRGEVVRRVTIQVAEDALRIIPEGRGTLAFKTITEDGLPHDPDGYSQRPVGIVNVGSGTTELLYYHQMRPVAAKTTGTNIGLSNVWQTIRTWARHEYNFEMSDYDADLALKEGFFYVGREKVSIEDNSLKTNAIGEQARQVGNLISTTWQKGDDVYFMICAGGGVWEFFPFLHNRFAHAELVGQSTISCIQSEADGAYRYGIFKALEQAGILKEYLK